MKTTNNTITINNIIEAKISDIKIDESFRQDMGDLEGLAESIKNGELLQPIGITPDQTLVFGERRLRAYRDVLGRETIPARIVDVPSILLGRIDENVLRKDYTLTEKIAIVDKLGPFVQGGDRRSDHARNSQLDSLTLADACKLVGISEDAYRSAKIVITKGVPELAAAMDSGELSIHAAETLADAPADEQQECLSKPCGKGKKTARHFTKQLRRIRNRKEREDALARVVAIPETDDDIQIHHCRFQNLEQTANITPDSIKLICTDIPYGKEFLSEIEELAAFAERVLAPGGVFVTYSGQYWLPEVMDHLGRHLTYAWTMASVWDGDGSVVNRPNVISKWKPIVVFSKGDWTVQGRWPDVLRVNSKEKNCHAWQQPLEEVSKLVSYFSKPGDLVVDPCGGGFTTAVACLKSHRRFIGCDCDQAAVVKGQERLAEEQQSEDEDVLPWAPIKAG